MEAHLGHSAHLLLLQEFETKTSENFIDKMLSVREPSLNIAKFTLRSDANFDASKVHHWISTLVRFNLEELNLALCVDKPFNLPISLFTCESLFELRLQLNICLINLPKPISIPKLKLLQLSDLGLDKLSAEQLILSSPLLEELVLSKCSWLDWNESILNISAPALKCFVFNDPVTQDGVRNGTVKIHAPNLMHLSYTGNIAKDYILSSFSLLVDAEVCFEIESNHLDTRGAEIGLAASKLVGALSNVRSLTISGETLAALSFANDLPAFQNLTHLTVTSNCKSLADKVLLKFFQSAPNLESLVLQGLPMCLPEFEQVGFWTSSIAIGCPFARLKSVHMKGFGWYRRELDFIKLVMKNARVVEKITIANTTLPLSVLLSQIEGMERAGWIAGIPLVQKKPKVKFGKKRGIPSGFDPHGYKMSTRHVWDL